MNKKLHIIDQGTPVINLKLDSMKRRTDKDSDIEELEILKQMIDILLIDHMNKKPLELVKDKKAIRLNIDVFLLDFVNLAYLEHITLGIKAALEDLQIPEFKITHNNFTNEDEIEIIEVPFLVNFKTKGKITFF